MTWNAWSDEDGFGVFNTELLMTLSVTFEYENGLGLKVYAWVNRPRLYSQSSFSRDSSRFP
jgi:hypothetical protein